MANVLNISTRQPPGKKIVINGDFRIWQRGLSHAAPGSASYTADRWVTSNGSDAVVTISKQAPGSQREFSDFLRVIVTTADTSIGTSQWYGLSYKVEGQDVRQLYNEKFATLSFWVSSAVVGSYYVSMYCPTAPGRSLVLPYSIDVADTWQKIELVFPMDVYNTTLWKTDSTLGLAIRFNLTTGSVFYTPSLYEWVDGNYLTGSFPVNPLAVIGYRWQLANVQLEAGNRATQFETRSLAEELALCQRYYEIGEGRYSGDTTNGGYYFSTDQFIATKRIVPTMTVVQLSTGGGFPAANPTVSGVAVYNFGCWTQANATSTGGNYYYSWIADAEL